MIKISIIIVTYNSEKDIFDCVDSIKTHADIPLEEIELIIVDNNSREPQPMFQRLREQWGEDIICIENTHNAGYGQGNNVGIRRSTAPIILIMNPDVRLCEPIFKKPLRAFEDDERLCIYGMKQLVGNGSNSTNSFSCSYMMNGYLYTFLTGLSTRLDRYDQRCMYISGACFFIRKEMFDAVGLFDESVFMYNEEDDIRYRLLKRFPKARIHYDKNLHYIHLGGDRPITVDYEKKLLEVAIIQNEKKGYSRQQTILNRLRNKRVLLWRAWLRYKLRGDGKENYETLREFCAYLKNMNSNLENNTKPNRKCLLVWFKKYNGILEGGGQANMRNYRMLISILGKENVTSTYIHDESKGRTLFSYLRAAALFPFGYHNGLTPQIVKRIVAEAKDYDYVFLNTSIFGIIAKRLKESNYKGKVIAHFHNVESIYYEQLISRRMPFRNVIINCAYKNDGYACKYADLVICLNNRDSENLYRLYNRKPDYIVPISLPDTLDKSKIDNDVMTSKTPLCTFIGSNFTANAEAVLWFASNVLPHINVRFKVVGKGMSKLKALHKELDNIEVLSDVPDLQEHFFEADFLVLPVFAGSGMKVKTCEALMYGKNILGTSETFEGYDIDYTQVGALCNTADDYISTINKFIESPIRKFNSYSRNKYEVKYSNSALIDIFKSILNK